MTDEKRPSLRMLPFEGEHFDAADRIATALGYTQTAYTTTSALWGLFCLPDNARQRAGCIILTRELGLMFVADLEDLKLHDEAERQVRRYRRERDKAPAEHIGKEDKRTAGQGDVSPSAIPGNQPGPHAQAVFTLRLTGPDAVQAIAELRANIEYERLAVTVELSRASVRAAFEAAADAMNGPAGGGESDGE